MRALQCLSLALLFLANAEPSNAQAAAAVTSTTTTTPAEEVVPETVDFLEPVMYDLGHKFSLNCTELKNADPSTIVWLKNNTAVETLSDLAGRYEVVGHVFQLTARSTEDDFGNYTCMARGVTGAAGAWRVAARAHAKLPQNTNVVEGQKLKLQCKLIGKPYPPVTWRFKADTDESNGTDVSVALGGRALLQRSDQDVEGGTLVIEAAERGDAGVYYCEPRDGASDSTTLRVKDMYAALWPFLGICIEVFILCAIILVYEKRRTKPELDDSDTDNHDQKKS